MRCLYGVSAFCLSALQPPSVLSCLSVAHADNLCYFAYQWRMYSDAFIGTCSGADQLLGHVNEAWQQLVHAVYYMKYIGGEELLSPAYLLFYQLLLFLFTEQRPSSISEQSHEKRYLKASLLVHSCLVLMQSSCCQSAFILPYNN